jgi:hypothetical protein
MVFIMNVSIILAVSVVISIVSAAFNGSIYGILTFIIALPVLLLLSLNFTPRKKQRNTIQPALSSQLVSSSSGKLFTWPTLSKFQFRIEGEPQYQPILEKLASQIIKNKKRNDAEPALKAYLIPDNTHKLVQVKIDDKIVGHLNISNARSFRRRLSAKKLSGQTTVCNALIGGGEYEDGRKQYYDVMLDLKPFT